jgi:hypothetical protein
MNKKNPPAQQLHSANCNEIDAVMEIKNQILIDTIEGVIFFCSSHYDLNALASAFDLNFECQIIGCTTAGEISGEYHNQSLVALVINSNTFVMHSILINNVKTFNLSKAMKIASDIECQLQYSRHYKKDSMFGFLLTDGLSLKEDTVISMMHQAMGNIHIIGGSAGDDLQWNSTFVFHSNTFYNNAATFMLLECKNDFDFFRMQHFEPTEKELITTDVDFDKHVVNQINGEPAAIAYANINNLDKDTMNNLDFSMYPLMLNIANEWYIRSISYVNPDYSLQFHCSVDLGLPLRIGTGKNIVQRLQTEIENIEKRFDEIYFTLGCDCILRRLEIVNKNYTKNIESLLRRINFIGFSSYGEQYNGIHFNQTLVAVVVGKKSNNGQTNEQS